MRTIRAGRGLGDALYLQAICRHLVRRGERLRAYCDWPEVFKPLADSVSVAPFRRPGVQLLAHYTTRKGAAGTTQFQDCCIQAGIRDEVDLRIDWAPEDRGLISRLKEAGRPIVCVQLPRSPMGRTDGFGDEVLPDCGVIQDAINCLRERALVVQVGAGKPRYRFAGIDVDLAGRTSVSQLLDVASAADAFLGYCSFLVPLAESFEKPALLVWSRRGLESGDPFIQRITPAKALHRPTSRFVVDDCGEIELMEAANALL